MDPAIPDRRRQVDRPADRILRGPRRDLLRHRRHVKVRRIARRSDFHRTGRHIGAPPRPSPAAALRQIHSRGGLLPGIRGTLLKTNPLHLIQCN